ncbi:MAG: alcohol dehydrogenase catalytic domain-containing protein [Lentilactobacillus diolivorans]|uniref:alcohol dehydrogenase catalytic domain-containing protein n=1 Tax=Lentilactobacillus diolivorans TaxID=179838 RepID=UPI0039E80AAA
MKAAYINKTGDSKEIIVGDLPTPSMNRDEVLVKVEAVSVNHVDTFVRAGSYKTKKTFPFVIGRDAVGTVVEVGSAVTNFSKGVSVWTNSMGYDGRQGVTSEYAVIPADRLYHLPAGVDPIQAVASVHSSATAAILINDIFEAQPEKTILIEGAAGHVGKKLVQIAHTMNLRVITTSNERDFGTLDALGSDYQLDYKKSLHKQLEKHAIDGVDYAVDTSGRVKLEDNLDALNQGGIVGVITAPKDNKFTLSVRQFYTQAKRIEGFVISHATTEQLLNAAKLLNQRMADGFLLEDPVLTKKIDDAAWAHRQLEKNVVKERVVLTM